MVQKGNGDNVVAGIEQTLSDFKQEEYKKKEANHNNESDLDAAMMMTPVPSDWQHLGILLKRNLHNDRKKKKLWFGRVVGAVLMLMLYTIGFFMGYNDIVNNGDQATIVLDENGNEVRTFPGELLSSLYPSNLRLASFDDSYTLELANTLILLEDNDLTTDDDATMTLTMNVTSVLNTTLDDFQKACGTDIAEWASQEVCVYVEAPNVYGIYFGGEETSTPFQPALAGAQWAMNQAILQQNSAGVDNDNINLTLQNMQQVPELVNAEGISADMGYVVTIGLLHVLASAIMGMFIIGPMVTENLTDVVKSFVLVGVKLRTYMLQWLCYHSLNGIVTAILFTLVSIYWNLCPMSNPFLLFASHFLGIVGYAALLVMLSQILKQDELAQGIPWLLAMASIAVGTTCLILESPDFIVLTLLTVISPMIGVIQYYAIYITYDVSGYDTGIHPGQNVVSSGLLANYMAQLACILLYVSLALAYSSPHFNAWLDRKFSHHQDHAAAGVPAEETKNSAIDDGNFEPLPPGADVLMSVRDVYHTYTPGCWKSLCNKKNVKPVDVLKGLNMDICRGEVFGFLGHNGAGKSTSVQIFSVEHALQEGNVTYYLQHGESKLANPDHANIIRSRIGVCPQHNDALQDQMTCREMLRLFCQLKGRIPKASPEQSRDDAIEAEIERRLDDIKFTSQEDADKPVGTYSGGMKRKVCIAMALLGDPEVVFLDEPTAGMDPYNRRQIWDMIIAAKRGRSIILTTHFLDEADVLSDRVGILKDGQLITCGGSLFLKHHFGVGYTLRYETKSVDISKYVPGAENVPREQPGVYEWRLGHGSEQQFPAILRALSQEGATNVTLELTTLEQVFLKTGGETEENDDSDDEDHQGSDDEIGNDIEAAERDADNLSNIWEPKGVIKQMGFWSKLFLVQNFMMQNAWRDRGAIFLNIGYPLLYLVGGLVAGALIQVPDKGDLITNDPVPLTSPQLGGPDPSQFFGLNITEGLFLPPLIPMEDPDTLGSYFLDPSLPVFGGYLDSNSTLQYNSDLSPFALQISLTIMSNYSYILTGVFDGIATTVQQLPFVTAAPFRADLLILPLCIGFGFTGIAFSLLDILLLKAEGIVSLFRVAGITEWVTNMGVLCYKFTTTFLPFFSLVIILGLALKSVLMGNAGRWLGTILVMLCYAYSATPIGLILCKRFIHSDYKAVANWFPGVYMTFFSLPYLAWVSCLQAFPESRDLIMIIGDVLCIVPQVAFQRGLGAVIEVSTKYNDPDLSWATVWSWSSRVWYTIAIMVFIGTCEWAYLRRLTSHRSKPLKPKNENEVAAMKPVEISHDPDLKAEHERSLVDAQGVNARELVKLFRVPTPKKSEDEGPILKRAVKGVSYGVRQNEIYALLGPNGSGKSVSMGMLASEHTPENGEVALAGQVATVADKDTGFLYERCNVAYCPQFDALFPKLTVMQHFKFYVQIRGLRWDEETTQVHLEAIIKLLGLGKHRNKEATELSGGYKRRLSLGLSMIGYPKAMMVDECTTGMDPGARHLVWAVLKPDTLHENYDLPAILLSSHYMDECEKLGTRIGIMINGEIVATGALTQLQAKYCTSYFVEVSLDPSAIGVNSDSGEETVIKAFEVGGMNAKVYESLPYHFKLQLPFVGTTADRQTQLADIFELLESEKARLGIKFYSVAQMNLEQIFMDLSRKQFEIEETESERILARNKSSYRKT